MNWIGEDIDGKEKNSEDVIIDSEKIPVTEDIINTKTIVGIREENVQLRANKQLSLQIDQIVEKNGGVWQCKICGRTTHRRDHITQHAETHIEGMSHDCYICSKTFSNRHCLRMHKRRQHSM